MKKKLFLVGLACLMVGGSVLTTSCGGSNEPTSTVAALSIEEFNVDETRVDLANIQEYYQVSSVIAKDNNGKYYLATISVKDPNGKEIELVDNRFLCSLMGDYKVTYTVTLDDNGQFSKTYTVSVVDAGEPVISSKLRSKKDAKPSLTDFHNITSIGTTYDLSDITVTDNSGENITPVIKVLFNGEEIKCENNIVEFDQKGVYSIDVTATDSSGNSRAETYNVYTIIDFENGVYYNNEWYATEISEDQALMGTHSCEFGMYDKATQWFNDYSLLGEVYLYETTAKYVSFWMYFDMDTNSINGEMVFNAVYHKMSVYDEYGNEVAKNWQDKYALQGNKWYRFLVNMQEMEMSGETTDKADAAVVKNSLQEIPFFICPWDKNLGANADKKTYVYVDDIRLVGDVDDEVYKTKPVTEYKPGEETTVRFIEDFFAKQLDSATGYVENDFAKMTIAHGTYQSYTPLTNKTPAGDTNYVLGSDLENGAKVYAWQSVSGYNDGVVYSIEAKQHIFAKFVEREDLSGWVDDEGANSSVEYAIYHSDTESTELLSTLKGVRGNFGCEYVELNEGDRLIFVFRFEWQDFRNYQNQSNIALATAVAK